MAKDISNNCKDESGKIMPVVDLNKCESKGPCIEACPYDVFEMRRITDQQFPQLKFLGKIKTFFHGREKAFVANPGLCHSCGMWLLLVLKRQLSSAGLVQL